MFTTSLRFCLGALLGSFPFVALATAQSTALQPPLRILAGDRPIDVTTGHASPYVLDFDGDGKKDLLVGEFGDGEFPVAELPAALADGWKRAGSFVNGRLRIYRNVGTDLAPRFDGFEYLQAGGGIATVPIT
ncbi:MAG: hypothetical protein MUC36_10665 [Planctomycetes bacterium]|jgi:hypothetical protein|nr:hypothetical protein [Planctomycetota bacterium]